MVDGFTPTDPSVPLMSKNKKQQPGAQSDEAKEWQLVPGVEDANLYAYGFVATTTQCFIYNPDGNLRERVGARLSYLRCVLGLGRHI